MTDAAAVITGRGGVANYRQLEIGGVTRAGAASALRSGAIWRVRNGWFAVPGTPGDVVRAARVGGSLTGASVARLHGLWLLADPILHVRVARTASRLASPEDRAIRLDPALHGVCVHYSTAAGTGGARDPLVRALAEMFACSQGDSALIALDSALNLGELRPHQLADLAMSMVPHRRWSLALCDGRSQSGLETLMRLFLVRQRIRVRSQVRLPRVGRVDLLVGDRLVLELDGEEFHTGLAFEEDRRRDFELVQQGYLVLRITYRMLMRNRAWVEEGILALVRRNEHRWRASRVGPVSRR
jgi:very-short-patch-repair endonuclease